MPSYLKDHGLQPGVATVAIIGSVDAGRAVMRAAADTVKPVVLELGGKNALVAFADAGDVHNQAGTACRAASTRCRAASVGVGLRMGWGPVQLRADIAQARHDAISTARGAWRGHVALSASF